MRQAPEKRHQNSSSEEVIKEVTSGGLERDPQPILQEPAELGVLA